jgi:hypothetical protein
MSDSARVASIEALKDFRTDLCTFGERTKETLAGVQTTVQRTLEWLEEQVPHWQHEVRRREDKVSQARAELERRKMIRVGDRTPDTTEQEKALRRAQHDLEEVQEKLRTTRRWIPQFRREMDEFFGPTRQFAGFLEAEQPRALALLQLRLDALEAYVQTAAPPKPSP